jgi:hypothetical protein
LDGAEHANLCGDSGIANDRRSRHGRRDLLEKLQPFSGDAIFELSKTGGVAARLGQAADQARSDRVGGVDEHHRHFIGGSGRIHR